MESMQSAMRETDMPVLDSSVIRNIIGLGMREALETLFPGISDTDCKNMVDRYRVHFFSGESSAPFEGVEKSLSAIAEQEYFMAVATGKGRNGLDRALKSTGFEQWFHASRCADETRSKPHPQMLEEILDELGVMPDKALMIGDTEYDLQMAKNVGMASAAVSYGVHETDRLLALDPEVMIHSMPELVDWLNED